MFTAQLRSWGFWASDRLQGAPIRTHCEDIEAHLNSGAKPHARLEGLLRHAVKHTRFYADYRGFGSLQDFPVINKNIIKTQYDAFRSDAFLGVQLHTMHTSGSTGTPFAVLQDPNKRRRLLAEVICFGRMAGYHVGDRFVFTRVWNRNNRKSWHAALRENQVMFDISSLDSARMEVLRTLLRTDKGIRSMLGYPSTFGPLIKHLEQCGDGPEAFHLRSIISISERLPPQTREALRSRFGCTVVSRYSNQENGVLAQQFPDRDEFQLNTASYSFEFLKLNEDEPAGPGERSRMVVTDLFNQAMPLIRYDTGDVVLRQTSAANGRMVETLGEIEGRRDDFIYDTRDRLLSSAVVDLHFWSFTRLKQYQFIQEAKGQYRIVLNGAQAHYRDAEFIDLAKSFLGLDASISVVHVEQIPLLDSGKFKSVLNLYKPTL